MQNIQSWESYQKVSNKASLLPSTSIKIAWCKRIFYKYQINAWNGITNSKILTISFPLFFFFLLTIQGLVSHCHAIWWHCLNLNRAVWGNENIPMIWDYLLVSAKLQRTHNLQQLQQVTVITTSQHCLITGTINTQWKTRMTEKEPNNIITPGSRSRQCCNWLMVEI